MSQSRTIAAGAWLKRRGIVVVVVEAYEILALL